MPTVKDLRNAIPGLDHVTDYEIALAWGKDYGLSPELARYKLNLDPPDPPGIKSSTDAAVGHSIDGVGRLFSGGSVNSGLSVYGRTIVQANSGTPFARDDPASLWSAVGGITLLLSLTVAVAALAVFWHRRKVLSTNVTPNTSSGSLAEVTMSIAPVSHLGGQTNLTFASPWKRAGAILIDVIVSGFLGLLLGLMLALALKATDSEDLFPDRQLDSLGYLVWWMYFAIMESSPKQATLGKIVFGLKVTDLNGSRIGFWRATGRHFGKFISMLLLMGGFIMAFFTRRRQALHDMMAGCIVIDTAAKLPIPSNTPSTNAAVQAPKQTLETDAPAKGVQMTELQRNILIGVGVVIAGMLLYPPYRVFGRGTNSASILDTGYAWLFDLPDRATVDAATLLVQWVGVMIVGGIAFLVVKGK